MTRNPTKQILTIVWLSLSILCNQCASIAGSDDREKWQPPQKIMDEIGVKPGMIIAEIGAGEGFFTFFLAQRVGPHGRILANDIDPVDLRTLKNRATREGIPNIEVIQGEIEDPLLPDQELDMMIMVYVLHHLDKPILFTKNLKKYLKPGIPLVIIERNTDHERAHPPSFMTKRQVLEAMGETGFKLMEELTFLPRDTIYIYSLDQ